MGAGWLQSYMVHMLKKYICRSDTGGLLVALKQNKVMCCRSLICQENGAADVRSTSGTGCAFDCEGIHAGQSLQEECHYLWNSVSPFSLMLFEG